MWEVGVGKAGESNREEMGTTVTEQQFLKIKKKERLILRDFDQLKQIGGE